MKALLRNGGGAFTFPVAAFYWPANPASIVMLAAYFAIIGVEAHLEPGRVHGYSIYVRRRWLQSLVQITAKRPL